MLFSMRAHKWAVLFATAGVFAFGIQKAEAQEARVASRSDAENANESDATEPILLRHKFAEGEILQWKIEHLATTKTSIQGNTQESRMKSVSTRQWQVLEIHDNGHITFVQTVEDVMMASKMSDRPEIKYDSKVDEIAPDEYAEVPETIGVPLATFTVAPNGEVINRESDIPPQDLGLGDIVMPFPEEPVEIGQTWDSERILTARQEDGTQIGIKARQRYALRRVHLGIAYIAVQTQVLTPNLGPRIRSQIMQQMTEGTILFDIEKGRVWEQEIHWDEEVIGFDSADSLMKYNARYLQTQKTEDDDNASNGGSTNSNIAVSPFTASQAIRLRTDKPLIRR